MENKENKDIPKPEEGNPEEPELSYEEQAEKDFHDHPEDEVEFEW